MNILSQYVRVLLQQWIKFCPLQWCMHMYMWWYVGVIFLKNLLQSCSTVHSRALCACVGLRVCACMCRIVRVCVCVRVRRPADNNLAVNFEGDDRLVFNTNSNTPFIWKEETEKQKRQPTQQDV